MYLKIQVETTFGLFGVWGSPNLHGCMQGMVVEMVDALEHYFSPQEQFQIGSGTQTTGDDLLLFIFINEIFGPWPAHLV